LLKNRINQSTWREAKVQHKSDKNKTHKSAILNTFIRRLSSRKNTISVFNFRVVFKRIRF